MEPRWLQNVPGAKRETGTFLLVSSREMWCSGASLHWLSPSFVRASWQWHSGRCFFGAIWASSCLGKAGFATRAKDCSHGEEQEEEQSRGTPERWSSCSCSVFSPSLSSPCLSQTDSRAMDILFPSVGATTHLACAWSRPWAFSVLF